uniref:LRRCT domain-containing protein n=1 Tax=Panagrellus redivivus TaxID=6233 RepID=A0A7E5A1C1_PANRE
MPLFPQFPLLTYVALNHNLLSDFGEPSDTNIRGSFDGIPDLTHLYLQNNSLTHITNVTFANLKELRIFDLSNNKLQHIAAGAFQNQRHLTEFNLSYNELTYLEPETFQNMDIYGNLYVNNNDLAHLSAGTFVGNKWLHILDLSNNHLTDIAMGAFNELNKLKILKLNGNKLTSIDGIFDDLENLKYLNVSNNCIVEISNNTFNNLPKIISVDLCYNRIEKIAPDSFVLIAHLYLNNNNLTTLEGVFVKEIQLTELYLSNNYLHKIKNTTFNHLTYLRTLHLANNQISYIAPYSFVSTKIGVLDISNNNLTTIQPYSLITKFPPLQTFHYKGNPLICDDKLKWFTDYVKYEYREGRWHDKKRDDAVYSDPVICTEPMKAASIESKARNNCSCACQ